MANYHIRKYAQHDLSLLRKDWKNLEKGKDMSFFQTFDWYVSINDVVPNKGEVVFIEVLDTDKAVLIAPLWILSHTYLLVNKRGCYFWGKDGYSDYLNFIYSEFDGHALTALFSFIQKDFGIKRYYFEFLQESTDVVSYIERYIPKVNKITFSYAALNLPDDAECYYQGLSKHARQNLRTAHNRMIKDGVSFDSVIMENCIGDLIRQKCEAIRIQRLPYKQQTETKKWSLKTRLHMFVDGKLRIKFPYKSVVRVEENGNILLITCGDEIAAFFYYGYEAHKKRIVVMTAGTNIKYARYSPGFYFMYQQIRNWIKDNSVRIVDFTRGDEKYKFYLGCEKVPVCNLEFIF